MNPAYPYQAQVDGQHLRLLAMFHFILGGLTFLGGCFFITIVGFMFWAANQSGAASSGAPPDDLLTVFGIFYGGLGLLGLALGIADIIAGVFLNRRRGKTFLWVVSAINCINMPLGTVLAVFTFIVLLRPSVIAEFDTAGNTTMG